MLLQLRFSILLVITFTIPLVSFFISCVNSTRSVIPATGSCRKDARKSTCPSGKHRKLLEHGSSIPVGNFSDFFPVYSYQLPVLSDRNRPKIIGKDPKNVRPEYCFHKITGITRNRPFPGRTVRPGPPFHFAIETCDYLIVLIRS